MSDRIEEQLLGYLLGALDDSEREILEEDLRHDPQLRRALNRVRRSLRCLHHADGDEPPPPGLAHRTCDRIFAAGPRPPAKPPSPPAAADVPLPVLPAVAESTAVWLPGTWMNMTVTLGVFFIAALLLFPAINRSRTRAQTLTCQDNLRLLGVALDAYSQHHGGYFPHVPAQGPLAAAGIYAPTLLRDGLIAETRAVLCPGGEAARQHPARIPAVEELQQASQQELPQLRREMGGSYGYCLGYLERGQYRGRKNLHRPHFALLADAPSPRPDRLSLHHGGAGQNVLFEDGRVCFVASTKPNLGDDIFLNDEGHVAAGLSADDAVIGPSDAAPLPAETLAGR